MAKSFRKKSASSGSKIVRPKTRLVPESQSDQKPGRSSGPTMRSGEVVNQKKKSIFSGLRKQPRGAHSAPLDSSGSSNSFSPTFRPSNNIPSGSVSSRRGSGRGTDTGTRLESRTIGEIKAERERQLAAEQRKERSKRRAKKARIPFIIGGSLIVLAIAGLGGYFWLSQTDTFKIETIDITGTDHLTKQEVSALVNVPQGTTLLTLDSDAIVASLERDAWVESVEVVKQFPNKLEIVVHERSITAVAEIPMGENQEVQNWAIAKDGVWLMAIPERNSELGAQISEQIYADAESVLHISDIEYGIEPEIGAQCTDPEILNALEIIYSMTTSLADQVKVVSAPDVEATMLVLKNNIEIAFGAAEDVRDKERICLQIIKDNPKVVYINIRVLDRPTWRTA